MRKSKGSTKKSKKSQRSEQYDEIFVDNNGSRKGSRKSRKNNEDDVSTAHFRESSKNCRAGSPKGRMSRTEDDFALSQKGKKQVKIQEPPYNTQELERKDFDPTQPLKPSLSRGKSLDHERNSYGKQHQHHTRSGAQKSDNKWQQLDQKDSDEATDKVISPRRKVFEAKFEKFVTNKHQKQAIEKRAVAMKPHDFDITTKSRESPSKKSANFKGVIGADLNHQSSGKYETEDLLPAGYETHLLKEELMNSKKKDPFKVLGVSAENKMTFFLLKWVFNAIKQTSDQDDSKLKGKKFMKKTELVSQLSKNFELMEALGIVSTKQLNQKIKAANCAKDGCLTWEEFLAFFFMQNGSRAEQADAANWWNHLDEDGNQLKAESEKNKSVRSADGLSSVNSDESSGTKRDRKKGYQFIQELQEVKMTPALDLLIKTRRIKTEQEVEEDFKNMQEQKTLYPGQALAKKQPSKAKAILLNPLSEDGLTDALGIQRDKAKCLLLPSQIQTMEEIYKSLDKYDDKILKRSEYLMRLRTDEKVVDFIDVDAVQLPNDKKIILTLDQVLVEIERDEMFEIQKLAKNDDAINHKEFITWREFLQYFEDYRNIDERNKKSKQIEKTRDSLQKNKNDGEIIDQAQEYKTLLQQEKERRLVELPKIRPADQIDINEQQLQLFKDIYDRQKGSQPALGTTNFFMAVRNNQEFRKIKTALARDPEGTSRIPQETFQQVVDRMEHNTHSKTIDWPWIVEFFTKRGRPLTREEIKKLQDEDKRIQNEEIERNRSVEEAEKRRISRLMEEIEGDHNDEFGDQEKKREEEKIKLGGEQEDRDSFDEDEETYSDYDDEDEFERQNSGDEQTKNRRRNKSQCQRRNDADEDLRNQHLTADDYVRHQSANSEKRKKGKYGITVPLPFKFDTREAVRPKTIRERKVEEMINDKKREEYSMLNTQFRCKPIPAAVLVPKYQMIQDRNEQRRLRVKQESIEITKQKEAPFSFWERDKSKNEKKRNPNLDVGLVTECKRPSFKANKIPVACTIPMYESKMKKEEEERAKRINSMAKIKQAQARMPSRMQQDADNKKQNPTQLKREEYSFKPQINEPKTASMFKKMQDKFLEKLNKRKGEFVPVAPKSPNFTKTKSKPLERQYLNEGGPQSAVKQEEDKFKAALARQISMAKSLQSVKPPSSTLTVELAQKRRREEMEQKKAQEEQKTKQDQERIDRLEKLKPTVQAYYKQDIMGATQKIEQLAKEKRETARKSEQEQKAKLQEIVEKARSKPIGQLSYQGAKKQSNLSKIQGIKKYLELMAEAGLSKNDAEKKLTDEEKGILEEDRYITPKVLY